MSVVPERHTLVSHRFRDQPHHRPVATVFLLVLRIIGRLPAPLPPCAGSQWHAHIRGSCLHTDLILGCWQCVAVV